MRYMSSEFGICLDYKFVLIHLRLRVPFSMSEREQGDGSGDEIDNIVSEPSTSPVSQSLTQNTQVIDRTAHLRMGKKQR